MSTTDRSHHTLPHQQAQESSRNGGGWSPRAELPEGPLDVVGDLHGELDALTSLLESLGYSQTGAHPQGRKLVFVGDLIDRGPDSPGVVRWVADLVDRGAASMVLGNHDLNALAGKRKHENTWLFGHGPVSEGERVVGSDREREEILGFLRGQPVVRERDDLRVVHACWDEASLRRLDAVIHPDPTSALNHDRDLIRARVADEPDPVVRALALQNENPIKVITSGPEMRASAPFFAGGKTREEARVAWWQRYHEGPVVVFGHYWRLPVKEMVRDDGLFGGQPHDAMLGPGRAICIDYSVGARASERKVGRSSGSFHGRLAALRWPERELVFDDGERRPVQPPTPTTTADRTEREGSRG